MKHRSLSIALVSLKFLLPTLLLLLSRFSRVRLCVTPETAAHQASPSLGFSRQEHWSGLPFPSPMQESESEVAQLCPTLRDPHGLQPTRLLCPWNFPGKSTGVGCHCLLRVLVTAILHCLYYFLYHCLKLAYWLLGLLLVSTSYVSYIFVLLTTVSLEPVTMTGKYSINIE